MRRYKCLANTTLKTLMKGVNGDFQFFPNGSFAYDLWLWGIVIVSYGFRDSNSEDQHFHNPHQVESSKQKNINSVIIAYAYSGLSFLSSSRRAVVFQTLCIPNIEFWHVSFKLLTEYPIYWSTTVTSSHLSTSQWRKLLWSTFRKEEYDSHASRKTFLTKLTTLQCSPRPVEENCQCRTSFDWEPWESCVRTIVTMRLRHKRFSAKSRQFLGSASYRIFPHGIKDRTLL